MNKMLSILFFIFFITACNSQKITNENYKEIVVANISSDFTLTDINNYDCGAINAAVIAHVIRTGILASANDIHDYYSTTGCSVKGTLELNSGNQNFSFDYGGILHIGKDIIIACGKNCCIDGFEYCSWDPKELSGTK